jgi:agmatine deiminase
MEQRLWQEYVASLEGEDRRVLDLYPFRWVYARPHDAERALEFLRQIGLDENGPHAGVIQTVYEGLTTASELERQGRVDWRGHEPGDEPTVAFRMIPEWETMAGVLLNWPTFYPPLWECFLQMVAALDHVTTFLRVPEGYLGATALAWLEAQGIDLDAVQPIPGPVGDIWARDYSPLYGVDAQSGVGVAHKFAFAAYGADYRMCYRYSVDVDERFAWKDGFDLRRTRILLDGGSILTDGDGTYILTRRALTDNASVPNLQAELERWLCAERIIWLDEQPGDTLGHINHIKLLGPTLALVGVPDEKGIPLASYLHDARTTLEDNGFEIVEMPVATGLADTMVGGAATAHGLYANSLMVNGRLLAAVFGADEHDEAALEVYRQALPGYEVIPIDASILANDGGAINCSSKEIPRVQQPAEG